jgi:hypothetical protein
MSKDEREKRGKRENFEKKRIINKSKRSLKPRPRTGNKD